MNKIYVQKCGWISFVLSLFIRFHFCPKCLNFLLFMGSEEIGSATFLSLSKCFDAINWENLVVFMDFMLVIWYTFTDFLLPFVVKNQTHHSFWFNARDCFLFWTRFKVQQVIATRNVFCLWLKKFRFFFITKCNLLPLLSIIRI